MESFVNKVQPVPKVRVCYVCGKPARILYPILWGELDITTVVCKPCLTNLENEVKGARN